jgi:hypothetical protein
LVKFGLISKGLPSPAAASVPSRASILLDVSFSQLLLKVLNSLVLLLTLTVEPKLIIVSLAPFFFKQILYPLVLLEMPLAIPLILIGLVAQIEASSFILRHHFF